MDATAPRIPTARIIVATRTSTSVKPASVACLILQLQVLEQDAVAEGDAMAIGRVPGAAARGHLGVDLDERRPDRVDGLAERGRVVGIDGRIGQAVTRLRRCTGGDAAGGNPGRPGAPPPRPRR